MGLKELLGATIEKKASDLHVTVGVPPMLRINGAICPYGDLKMLPQDVLRLLEEILEDRQLKILDESGDMDTSYSVDGLGRFRFNIYKQRGTYAFVARAIPFSVPDLTQLGLPPVIGELANISKGMILVTGPTGSGKSTTLAAMLDKINNERNEHIITLEDPIEFLHRHRRSIINQREIGCDTKSFAAALRSSLRQDPDIILVGEMRDLDTIATALTAAETGHLVLSTLHTIGAAKTIDRIIDVFPPHQQSQIRVQLSTVLQAVVSQQLIPRADGKGRVAAVEVMVVNNAIRNLIREGKSHQIASSIQTGSKYGMQSMDSSINGLYRRGLITEADALTCALDPELVLKLG
ncbi:MAG TPA: type IV pilus twitching motility protein PilT [Clostridia bacterium]|nr:type IV pilus twitching motility protein PilT [Clostridia bacterium]